MHRACLHIAVSCFACLALAEGRTEEIDLAGRWAFRLDPSDEGVRETWFDDDLPESIRLPGSLQEQGFGDDVSIDTAWTGNIIDRSWFESPRYEPFRRGGNVKIPFWLQPEKHYIGPAWYQTTLEAPQSWQRKHVTLVLERPHWETVVWLDGRQVGSDNSLSTPHVYDLTDQISPGRHRLTIRVDNRIKDVEVGVNSHSVSDHTQSNWNGIVGRMAIEATDPVWIDDLQVFADVAARSARVVVTLGGLTGEPARGSLTLDAVAWNSDSPHDPPPKRFSLDFQGSQAKIDLDYPLGDGARTWDEFHPALYRLTATLEGKSGEAAYFDEAAVTFGLREIAASGTQFVLNGGPIFLRGTLDCCVFPLTGYPPTDVESWERIIGVAKRHGLNHMRFHSWCPPEAAFAAADRLGFYFQVECSSWANQGATVGDGRPLDAWLYREADRILRSYGNHPSFLLMAYGNEPAGPGRGAKFLAPWVDHYKAKDPRRLYTAAAGWPIIPESQYLNTPAPRIQQWGAGLDSRINAREPETVTDYRETVAAHAVPLVSHEIGQWCVYPDFDEIPKYTGVLKPKNFEIFRSFLEANHMGDLARPFLMASGKLQALSYKEEIESALRTPGFGGFQLLDLHDFPGQGTALVGVLDPFWDSKPYITPDEFRRFSGHTVPLARLPKRIFTTGDELTASVELCHFGPSALADATVGWRIVAASGEAVAEGKFPPKTFPRGKLHDVGPIEVPLGGVEVPQKLRLAVGVEETPYENDWDLWVFPAEVETAAPKDVLVADELDEAAIERLRSDGKVMLLIPPRRVAGDVAIGFSPVFWNTAWTRNQPPHTLGILCDPEHPALARFPTEYHSNWQWWELVGKGACGAMVLDGLPPELRPIVQPIDTWFEARRLGLVFEATLKGVGGKLLVASIDLAGDLDHRPAARQMRHSLLAYMAGEAFDPQVEVDAEAIRGLMRPASPMEALGAAATADSTQPGYPAANVLDRDPETIWHTAWGETAPGYPHYLTIDLGRPLEILGLDYLPRRDMTNGRIADFEIYVSLDGEDWGEPAARGKWPNSAKWNRVVLKRPQQARYVKLVASSEVQNRTWASAAEVEVVVR